MLQIARNQWRRTCSRRLINATGSTAAVRLRSRKDWCGTLRGGTWNRPRRTRTVTADGWIELTEIRSAKARKQGKVFQAPRRVARTNLPAYGKGVRARDPSMRDTNCSFTCGYTHKRSRINVRSVSSSSSYLLFQRLQVRVNFNMILAILTRIFCKNFLCEKKMLLFRSLYRFM